MKKGLGFAVVLGVMLSGCYLFVPNDTTGIASITVDPAYLTVGPGEQVTVNVTTVRQGPRVRSHGKSKTTTTLMSTVPARLASSLESTWALRP